MKNKFYLMGLIGLTLATSNIALGQSFMNSDGTVDWKKVDNLTARDRWMEVAYDDTLSDGKKKAQDEAMSTVAKALEAQKKYDDAVADAQKRAANAKEKGLTPLEKYAMGTMTNEELADYAAMNKFMADLKESSGVDSVQEAIDLYKNNPNLRDLPEETIEKLEKYYDEDVVNEMLEDENHPFHGDDYQDSDEFGAYQKLVDNYAAVNGSNEDRQKREEDFWNQDIESSLVDGAKKDNIQDIYNTNRDMENALTPEMKNTLMGAMGVSSAADVNDALNDPTKKQELQTRLDTLSTQYSDFPKIDLNTEEGRTQLNSIVGTTSDGKLGTIEYHSDRPATVQTTQEKNEADVQKAMNDFNDMFNNRNVINGVDIMGGSYNIYTGEYNTPSWATGIGTGSGDANTGTGTGDGVSTGGLGASTTE